LQEEAEMFTRILLAIDSSEHSRKAVPVTIALAAKSRAEVLVLHVHDIAFGPGVGWCVELVEGIAEELKQAGVAARGEVIQVVPANPAHEILKAAEPFQADLIVMGSRGLSDLAGLLVGSVTHKVLHLARTPVLVVPAEKATQAAGAAPGLSEARRSAAPDALNPSDQ
jgi:nucleotide-binding universal stress UspA family protein